MNGHKHGPKALAAIKADQRTSSAPTIPLDDRSQLATRAANILRARQLRSSIFRQPIFGEPAWDMLIALYIADFEQRKVTASGLAEWAQCPKTTALRWQRTLEDRHLISRAPHPADLRMSFISLTELGREALDEFFRHAPTV